MQLRQNQQLVKLDKLIFGAVAQNEKFQDVHTITLKGEFMKRVEIEAVDNLLILGVNLTQVSVRAEMARLVRTKSYLVQEAVHNTSKGMFVVVNADTIDDTAISSVYSMVSEALDQLNGKYGVIKFNQPVSFTLADIPWINYH
jgi:hypothetical protein